MATGTLKRFFHDKGYGFIKLDGEEKDVFVHKTGVQEGEYINEGDKVEFEITRGEKGAKAENVKKSRNP